LGGGPADTCRWSRRFVGVVRHAVVKGRHSRTVMARWSALYGYLKGQQSVSGMGIVEAYCVHGDLCAEKVQRTNTGNVRERQLDSLLTSVRKDGDLQGIVGKYARAGW